MNVETSPMHKDQKTSSENSSEIGDTEKELWALIYSRGLLNSDVLVLYRKVRSSYEKIILNNSNPGELQEAEFHLWKLHYKHSDEFRKWTKQNTERDYQNDNLKFQSNVDRHLEGFRTFLSEAIEFYKNLIIQLRKFCGLPAKVFLDNTGESLSSILSSIEPTNVHRCQYTCHRLLVCLGDLARYTEVCKKLDARKWSIAASYYLEAARTCPDSGNPHNQLALLARYEGDVFLALYHCIRSLAVKEPFPDSWNNLMLLFEENWISHLQSLSTEVQFDFSNPSKRIFVSQATGDSSNYINLQDSKNISSSKFNTWHIFVQTISFFLIQSSLEEFSTTVASAMTALEALLSLDDAELNTALESYQHLDSSKKGPHRAIQFVCILIFTFHNLAESSDIKDQTDKDNNKLSEHTSLALAFMFICMGRLSDRCLKICPLLPAVLVFVEWLVDTIDRVEAYVADERVMNAVSYFFSSLADLLNQLDENFIEIENLPEYSNPALWEDHELRGFYPLNHAHSLLDFTTRLECGQNSKNQHLLHCQRIFHLARKIANSLCGSQNWIFYNKVERKFYTGKVKTNVEDEEVILFKPIKRHNSAPLHNHVSPKDKEIQSAISDEFLRRATSLCISRDPPDDDSFSFCSVTSGSEPGSPFDQQESQLKDSTIYPSGPPSLSAWFLSRESSTSQPKLSPIEEIPSTSFSNTSVTETKDSEDVLGPHISPLPSAPVLPDDADWYNENDLPPTVGFPTHSPIDRTVGHHPGVLGLVNGYPALIGMSSSEWLYHYRNSLNSEMAKNHVSPVHYKAPSFPMNDVTTFGFYDQWGNRFISNPTVYSVDPRTYVNPSVVFSGCQRLFPYACGVGMELRTEQAPLVQCVKDREWQLQPDSKLKDQTLMR